MDIKLKITPEKWKFICAALQATGTLDLEEAYNFLTCTEVQELARQKSGVKAGNPLYHTDKQPNDLVCFILLFQQENGLCLSINHLISTLYNQVSYTSPISFDTWKVEFTTPKTAGRSTTAMKAGAALKALQKIIKDYIDIVAEDSTPIIIVKTQEKFVYSFTGKDPEKIELEIYTDSLGALVTGRYEELDPVTGDASCEMRVPFLLDCYDIIKLKPQARPEELQIDIDNLCTFSNIVTSKGTKKRSSSRYLGLCRPLTIMRTQAKDHFLFLIDDRPTKYMYSFNVREAIKSDMATYNVDYMRALARKYAEMSQVKDRPLTMESMISNMMHNCVIEMSKGGNTQPLLPIFTAMRLILMHEIKCGRPIAVALTRIGYMDKNQSRGYKACGSKVFYYKTNMDKTGYDYVPEDQLSSEDMSRPITVFHAYNMFPLHEDIHAMEANDNFFFSKDWDAFERGFVKCDITHLIRCWAAAHPPVPKSSKLWINEGQEDISQKKEIPVTVTGKKVALNSENRWVVTEEDIELSSFVISLDDEEFNEMRGERIREYIEKMQSVSCPSHKDVKSGHRLPDFELSCQGLPLFGLTELEMDLLSEYQYYKELSIRNDLFELHYASDTGDETITCALKKGTDLVHVEKDEYEKNTSAKKKLPSESRTQISFMRAFGAAPFSPVHVFLSSYQHEVVLLGNINANIMGPQISLTFIETDDGEGNGSARWEISEDSLSEDDFV